MPAQENSDTRRAESLDHALLHDWPQSIAQGRVALAPSWVLHVGVYTGSPSAYVPGGADEPDRGVAFMLGRAAADALGVAFKLVVFPKNADLLAAVAQDQVDLVLTNATQARSQIMTFSPTLLDIEKSVLVPAHSPYVDLDSIASSVLCMGVSTGSSSGTELAALYPRMTLHPVAGLQTVVHMLVTGELDGFASNKAILFELADQLPGASVLPGAWGVEHFALGTPKTRVGSQPFLAGFAHLLQCNGRLAEAVAFSRLRGTIVALTPNYVTPPQSR